MSRPITKRDLIEALAPVRDGMSAIVRQVALGFDQARAERERFDDALNAKIDKRYSDALSHVDAFMAQTLAARNDQSFLIHRVDKLEERVDRLEGDK